MGRNCEMFYLKVNDSLHNLWIVNLSAPRNYLLSRFLVGGMDNNS